MACLSAQAIDNECHNAFQKAGDAVNLRRGTQHHLFVQDDMCIRILTNNLMVRRGQTKADVTACVRLVYISICIFF